MFATPVIYIFFNRPNVTRRTFAAIRRVRPSRLYLIADGPRPGKSDDAARCRETREIVERMLDWPCEVTRDYSDTNLGCGLRLASGLTSAFALLGEAIVLEDDILPHSDFFPFCASMLAHHRDDPRIHAISGFNPLSRYAPARGPATPSTFAWIWGWASWQRAWKDYRFDLTADWSLPEVRQGIREHVANDLNFQWHARNFDNLIRENVDTWDFQWSFAQLAQRRVTLTSSVNLIENLGFDSDATHTAVPVPYLRGLRAQPVVSTHRERPAAPSDKLHDKLYGQILHSDSPLRIAFLRLLAQFPALAHRLLKV
ncbi:MAG: hypothetical protein PHC88_09915 [Terrimicrobiaceae bacterium]|nr:hypothetical protein [Terrimicrobiaceae bacterium]